MKNYGDKILRSVTVAANGCWLWQGWTEHTRYGRTRAYGKMYLAHRLAYECFVGPIPERMLVCHKCDNPPCCNPAHLFLGNHTDNHRDAVAKGRSLNRWPQEAVSKQRVRKLSHAQVDEILTSSESTASIAKRMGCSYQNVYLIRTGKRKVAPRG